MNFVVSWRGFALISIASLFVVAAKADPVAGRMPPERGQYETSWGKATFEYDRGDHTRGPVNGGLKFEDGHMLWGHFEKVEGTLPATWVFIGRWVATQDNRGALPRTLSRARKCSQQIPHPSYLYPAPNSYFWGSIRLVFASDGKQFRGSALYCTESPVPVDVRQPEVIRGSFKPLVLTEAPHTIPAPSTPHDGQCGAESAIAVATIKPCSLRPGQPLQVQLTRDLRKGTRRIVFTPLSDDAAAIEHAIKNNHALPIHSGARAQYQVVDARKLWQAGDARPVVPPGSLCAHPFWAVSLQDGIGTLHPGNGVITMKCGSEASQPPLDPVLKVEIK